MIRLLIYGSKAERLGISGLKENPEADIDFMGVRFEQTPNIPFEETPNIPEEEWPFEGFNFPKKGNVSFKWAKFGDGNVSFREVQFGDGDVIFEGAEFGEGNVSFDGAKFGKGNVSFTFAKFGEGDVCFAGIKFGEGIVNFIASKFGGHAVFEDLKKPGNITMFSFQYCDFNGGFNISSKETFSCVPDLRYIKTTHQVALDGLTYKPKKETKSWWKLNNITITDEEVRQRQARNDNNNLKETAEENNKNDIQEMAEANSGRLCRLKEIAEANKDHLKAMDFKVLEMKFDRIAKDTPLQVRFFEYFFEKFSNYGRSIFRPIIGLAVLWGLFAGIYGYFVKKTTLNWFDMGAIKFWEKVYATIGDALGYSASQMFLFFPSTSGGRDSWAKELYGVVNKYNTTIADIPSYVPAIAICQNLLAVTLIFLVVLGLRNRFRI